MIARSVFKFVRLRPSRSGKAGRRADGRTQAENEIVADLIVMQPGLYHAELVAEAASFYEAKHARRREQLANEREQGQ